MVCDIHKASFYLVVKIDSDRFVEKVTTGQGAIQISKAAPKRPFLHSNLPNKSLCAYIKPSRRLFFSLLGICGLLKRFTKSVITVLIR